MPVSSSPSSHLSTAWRDKILTLATARAAIEDEYARKLLSLCRKAFGTSESGSLRISLDVVRGETESIGRAHAAIASQMKGELEDPMIAFFGGLKERRKIIQNSVERLLKTKIQQTQAVNKVSFCSFFPSYCRKAEDTKWTLESRSI